MNLDLGQIQNLSQRHLLTPELVQAIKLLQFNNFELESYVQEELLSNPLLEINEEREKERVYDALSHRIPVTTYDAESESDNNYENYTVAAKLSLAEFLHLQLGMLRQVDNDIKKIATYIIDTLDENGYRTERATEIARKLDYTHDEVMGAIEVIQSLEPAGIAAKNLEESLKLQLVRLGVYDNIFEKIISSHLQDLAANRLGEIAKDCKEDIDTIQNYCDIIRSLNPKPGKRYGRNEENRYIIPDCYLDIVDGEYIITVNDGSTPKLQMSPYYARMKAEAQADQATMDYLNERMKTALWLIKGIDQRRQTIYNVSKAIMDYQRDFFEKGSAFLRPMTLETIANMLGIHESTVSRTVNEKYIQTPRGLFELKYFFGGGMVSLEGDEISVARIKNQIKEIIAAEDNKHPYSDEKIKEILANKYSISIARRTIAKYRDELGIPGGSKRKRF